MSECKVPPPGWSCSRGAGHDGPCAASPTTDTSNMAKALRGEPVEITLPRLVEMREQAIAGATYTPGLPGWMHWHWVAALNEVIAKRAAPEPRGKEPPHCPSCNCGEHILGPPETKREP